MTVYSSGTCTIRNFLGVKDTAVECSEYCLDGNRISVVAMATQKAQ